jgi:hypothetical protein
MSGQLMLETDPKMWRAVSESAMPALSAALRFAKSPLAASLISLISSARRLVSAA